MRKVWAIVLTGVLILGLASCGNTEPKPQVQESEPVQQAEDEDAAQAEEPQTQIYTNDYGFTFSYNPAIFTIEESGTGAVFRMIGREDTNQIPVYLSVSVTSEYARDDLAEGLQLQSGSDDATLEDTTVGAGSYEAKQVYYTLDTEAGEEQMLFYLIQIEEVGVIQIEICSGVTEDEMTSAYMEELIGSFTME